MSSNLYILIFCAIVGAVFATEPPAPFNDHCYVGEKNFYDPTKASDVPWFDIDLDKPALHRWDEISLKYKAQIVELIGVIKSLTIPFFQGRLIQFIDKYLANWDKRIPQPYADEIRGIANVTGVPLGEIVLYNVFYEIFTVCTSIVAVDPTGKLYHARNLDFGIFIGWNKDTHDWATTEKLRPLVINLRWLKDGKVLYKSVNFAGFIGVYNGLRQNSFTLSANERFDIDGGWVGLIKWLLGLSPNAKWMTWLTREAMEQATDYQHAYHMLSTQELMSPVFYIIGGTRSDQGAIITRSREKTLDVQSLRPGHQNGWYILQTNYDPGVPPLFLDDRRTPGNACVQKLGQAQVGFQGLFNVLSSPTNLNKLTSYTILMQVNSAKFETYIQKCPDPCWFV